MAETSKPEQQGMPVEHSGTLIETDDEIRQALLSEHKGTLPQQGPASAGIARPAPAAGSAAAFRPTVRPPIALLTVFDDGKTTGEVVRIRSHRFIIGRTEGDFCIPLDNRMSARHVEITHQVVGGLHRWVVTDLQSTHGMFVRVSRTVLADKAECLVGNGRYRFDAPVVDAGPTIDQMAGQPGFGATHGWDEGAGRRLLPSWSARTSAIGCSWSRMNTGSVRMRLAQSAGRMIRFASRGTCGFTAGLEETGTPSITRRPTGFGFGCRRLRWSRWPSFRLVSNGFSSR